MARDKFIHNSDNQQDSTEILKLLGRTLSHLSALEQKIDFQDEILFELRKNQNSQTTSNTFEPIRGIHGLAKFLGISPVTAQKLKNSGKIPFAQFERLVLFDPQKVLDALELNSKPKRK